MKRYLVTLLYAVLLMFFLSCGQKGPLQPPIVRIPKAIENAELIQRGDKLFLRWENPVNYIDGNPLIGLGHVEIWLIVEDRIVDETAAAAETVLPAEPNWNREFKKRGRLIHSITRERLPEYIFDGEQVNPVMQFVFPLEKDFISKTYYFSLKVKDVKRRKSLYSTPVSLEPAILPRPPMNFRAESVEGVIVLRWDPPGENIDLSTPPLIAGYNVYRAAEKSKPVLLNRSLIQTLAMDDTTFDIGVTYSYFGRVSATESSPYQESGDSNVIKLTTTDTLPPAPPRGLVIVTGPDIISLSWEANLESDFGGYRVWRRTEGSDEFTALTKEPFPENTYTDTDVEKNVRYYYAITSMDESGNESQRSRVVSDIIKDGCS